MAGLAGAITDGAQIEPTHGRPMNTGVPIAKTSTSMPAWDRLGICAPQGLNQGRIEWL